AKRLFVTASCRFRIGGSAGIFGKRAQGTAGEQYEHKEHQRVPLPILSRTPRRQPESFIGLSAGSRMTRLYSWLLPLVCSEGNGTWSWLLTVVHVYEDGPGGVEGWHAFLHMEG